jgi:hypothetical protein
LLSSARTTPPWRTPALRVRGRQLLAPLRLPEPWQGTIKASLGLIDQLDHETTGCERELRRLGADQRPRRAGRWAGHCLLPAPASRRRPFLPIPMRPLSYALKAAALTR